MADNCCTTITVPIGLTGPPGPQAPLFVSNTVFVDELYGNNATALVERRDLPFQTRDGVSGALAAAQAMVPTSDKRIMIDIDMVESSTPIELSPFIDYNLNGGSIVVTAGSTSAIDDLNDACNSIIYNANIIQKTGGTNNFGLRTQNGGTILTVHAKEVTSSVDAGASIEGGSVEFINTRITTTVAGNENAIEKSGGTLKLNSCILIATGTGFSLFATAPTQTVIIEGSSVANLNKNANITLAGGLFVVSAAIS